MYAQREQQGTNEASFKGGGAGIYLSGSALAVVLVVVLLIIVF